MRAIIPLLSVFLSLLMASPQAARWQAAPEHTQRNIWPGQAPDALVTMASESTAHADQHGGWTQVRDVSQPTITVYAPKGRNTRAAVVVFPGGGFRVLAIDLEGTEICAWLSSKGITCVLLKYRVPQSNHHWDEQCQCHITPKAPRALQDAQRAIRLVRSQAPQLQLDPDKIGVIGFSAGGYLVAQTSTIFTPAYRAVDAVDKISSRPDFAIALYPGHLCRAGDKLDPGIRVTQRTPPTFLLQAWDDPVDPVCNSTLYARALNQAGVPAEVHLFARGGHAFGLREKQQPVASWPELVEAWLKQLSIL